MTREMTAELERDPVYVVRTPAFDGPIELLLSLAQRAEVDLKTISLASLTDDYLRAIEYARRAVATDPLVPARPGSRRSTLASGSMKRCDTSTQTRSPISAK